MIQKLFLVTLLPLFTFAQQKNVVQYVNPLMGTDSKYSVSNGNTYPSISLPFGMNSYTPQTNNNGNGWQYQYSADKIVGFKQTHQPSPWINDYGVFSLMPITGTAFKPEHQRGSWFSHKLETATPYYYKVFLADYNTTAEITPTERCSQMRFTFGKTDSAAIIIDGFDGESYLEVQPEKNRIIGYSTYNNGGVASNFKNYFVIQFNQPIAFSLLFNQTKEKTIVPSKSLSIKGFHALASIGFNANNKLSIVATTASSFISIEQAIINMNSEIGNDNFETTKQKAFNCWNKYLGRIIVEDDDIEKKKTFYSCLYRCLLFPRKVYEVNAKKDTIHYSFYKGSIEKGVLYTDNGFWDTFRAEMPLLNLVYADVATEIIESLANTFKESGWLPEWASPGHRDCMIGSNSAAIIADAFMQGVPIKNIELLYEALLKNTQQEGPISSVGRKGVNYYNQLGYIPYDMGINENVARTLEYAYADFCMYQLAKGLQKADTTLFKKRLFNYKNVFDKKHLLMRGRNKDGSFQTPYNPFKWGDAFTEGNAWHYSWSVFQDIKGLQQLMGGSKKMEQMLDSVFTLPPIYDESYYGQVIHEIKEMQLINMGQYAHGNQPIQHMPYLYMYCNNANKTQYWVQQIMQRLYKPTPDGYCGDEDNGQTSAWYVMSALGFYSVTPASNEYVIGIPIFSKAAISISGATTTIIKNATNNSVQYVHKLTVNNKHYNLPYFTKQQFTKGCNIVFSTQQIQSNNNWFKSIAQPFSFSDIIK